MTDEFLTKGLQNDRYLKAIQLIEQFEDEIEAILRDFNQRMVDEHSGLFDSRSNLNIRSNRSPSSGLATHRINHPMNGERAPDTNQRLNVHLYWMPPTEYDRTEVDGALRGFGYKIKGADEEMDKETAGKTRAGDWPIKMSGNPYDSNTVFYREVSSKAEIDETVDILVDHFSEFGENYASDSDALS